MADHYCSIHNTVYFKKGNMRSYAHPILDAEGKPTGKWCNEGGEVKILPEHQAEIDKVLASHKDELTPSTKTADGKNGAFALSYSKDITVALINTGIVKEGGPKMDMKILERAELFKRYLAGEKIIDDKKLAQYIQQMTQSQVTKEEGR